jgi:uncharacterized phage protein (TIGR01671 family)
MIPKFRVWHKKRKKMLLVEQMNFGVESSYKNEGGYVLCVNHPKGVGVFYPKEIVLMQSTSLKDKNDKEIFEGDIIKIDKKGWNELLKVYWYKGFYRAISEDGVADASVCNFNDNNCEVIGNVYENPELMKVKK